MIGRLSSATEACSSAKRSNKLALSVKPIRADSVHSIVDVDIQYTFVMMQILVKD